MKKYRDLLSLDTSGGSINQNLTIRDHRTNAYSLSIDNIDNGTKLTEVRSVVNVGDASNLNKTSENLEKGETSRSGNDSHSPSVLFLLARRAPLHDFKTYHII